MPAAALAADWWPTRATLSTDTPWIPLGPGRAFKPIRFFSGNRGYVALMRVDPGTAIPRHRHTGEVHALTLEGERELADGVRIGPGDYVYEAAGNTDTWRCASDVPVVVLIVVKGEVEYLGPGDEVTARYSGDSQQRVYRDYCADQGLPVLDLVD